jgi:hypothetical protein
MVERFFAEITRKRISCGAFKSVAELKSARFLSMQSPWTQDDGDIVRGGIACLDAAASVRFQYATQSNPSPGWTRWGFQVLVTVSR